MLTELRLLDPAAEAARRQPRLKNLDPFSDQVRLEPGRQVGVANRGDRDKIVIFSSSI